MMITPKACFTRTIHAPGLGKALMPAPAKGHGAAMPRPRTNGNARAAGVPVA
jgi:hypothetical protein